MVGNVSFLRGFAYGYRNPAKKNTVATDIRRVKHALMAMTSAALLSACAGSLPFASGGLANDNGREMTPSEARAYAKSTRAAKVAVATGKPEHMRAMTAQQIMTEWGTLPPAKGPYRRGRPSSVAHANNLTALSEPDYMSVDEIMTNAACNLCEEKPYHREVLLAANLHGVPAALIHAVIQKESSYNPAATSKRRARGLMQITPETGRYMGVKDSKNLYDPQTNINTGTAYLKYLMESHDTVDEVLAAYNSGPGNVRRYRGVPPFKETRRYVHDVKKFFSSTTKVQTSTTKIQIK